MYDKSRQKCETFAIELLQLGMLLSDVCCSYYRSLYVYSRCNTMRTQPSNIYEYKCEVVGNDANRPPLRNPANSFARPPSAPPVLSYIIRYAIGQSYYKHCITCIEKTLSSFHGYYQDTGRSDVYRIPCGTSQLFLEQTRFFLYDGGIFVVT